RNAGFLGGHQNGLPPITTGLVTLGLVLRLRTINEDVEYEVTFSSHTLELRSEKLAVGGREVFEASGDSQNGFHVEYGSKSGKKSSRRLNRDRSALRELVLTGDFSTEDTDLLERLF